jgi:putative tricarboxylic transport membrane protein
MKISDRGVGVLLIFFAASILAAVRDFPVIPGQSFGSALLPTIIAIGLIIGAMGLIITDMRNPMHSPWVEFGSWITDGSRKISVAIIIMGTISYVPLVSSVGFPMLSAGLLLALLLSVRVKPAAALAVSIVAALSIHTLFSKLFLVPLPWGVLQPLAW